MRERHGEGRARRPPDSFSGVYRDALEHARPLADGALLWRVYELPPPSYDRRRGGTLVFEHAAVIRCVRDYPADWRTLDDRELLRLCRRR
ncbi:MAG TPA: hypothetical protein VEA99_12400 [Gemmatimonadaceae bacterium]|nr:hypothetical protein [Gemmatimonadaceae bacterium]